MTLIADGKLRPRDLARELNVTPQTVARWILRGSLARNGSRHRLKATRLPGGWLIDRADFQAFLDVLAADAIGEPIKPRVDMDAVAAAVAACEASGW